MRNHSSHFDALREQLGQTKVLSDQDALTAYSVDASIYKVVPQAIAIVENKSALEACLVFSKKNQIPLTARSGGTNLTGNAVGEGLILEFSRLNRILDLDKENGVVRVEPGMVQAELNKKLLKSGWTFAPDPSSSDMCKLGGMLGNNASGPRSLKYGATKDNVLEMEILLASGNWITAKNYALNDPSFIALCKKNPEIETLYTLIRNNSALIHSRKRPVAKNSSGYNLFSLAEGIAEGQFPLHKLFIGSEGTLGLTIEATLRLIRKPTETATGQIYLKSLSDVGAVVNLLLTLSPSALEMMDKNSLDLVGREKFSIPSNAQVMLLVEFDASAKEKIKAAKDLLKNTVLCSPMAVAMRADEQARLWQVRKAMYPTLYRYDQDKNPINFANDVVVAASRIPELVVYLEKLFKDRNITVSIYGHIGEGNAHINPLLNLDDPVDFQHMIDLSHEIHNTIIDRFDGSLCGEHGDGRVRAEFVEQLYGSEVYALFKQVKKIFDPQDLLNPGIKISKVSFTEHIDFARLSTQCASCAKCNSVCPVYDVVGEESNAARGWFHVLSDPDYNYDVSKRVVEACINCKSCRTICPAGVDVSELVLKARAQEPNETAGKVLALAQQDRIFPFLLKLAAHTQKLWDRPFGRQLIEYLSELYLKGLSEKAKIPADMVLPKLAKKHLRERYKKLTEVKEGIAYFHGCAANYLDDGVGDAVIQLLKQQGQSVALPPQRCSGTPIETYGFIDTVRENARFNLKALKPFTKVVTGCASCTLMLKDYPKLLDGDEEIAASELASKVVHISEFMSEGESSDGLSVLPNHDKTKKTLTYHSSCHLRAAGVKAAPRQLLKQHGNYNYVEMADSERCAGGAGTFCIKNPEQSAEIFKRKKQAIEASGADVVATSCPACMIQLNNGLKGKTEVKHIAQILLEEPQHKQ